MFELYAGWQMIWLWNGDAIHKRKREGGKAHVHFEKSKKGTEGHSHHSFFMSILRKLRDDRP
jgi:hypothetical protein